MAVQDDLSEDSQFFRILEQHKSILEAAKSRKGEIPTDHEDKKTLLEEYRIQYDSIQQEKEAGFEKTRLQSTVIGEPYYPSVASYRDLNKIVIKELMLETHHRGRYMLLRVAAPPVRMSAVITVVEDEVGDAITFSLYQQEPENVRPAADILQEGAVLLLKEPYFKITGGGQYGIRVDHPTDLIFLSDTDASMPIEWRLESLSVDSKKTADEWKQKGNALMGAGNHREAIEMYSRALDADPTHAEAEVIHNNRALSFLKIRKYDAALDDVAFVPEVKDRSEKALYRGALALYNLRRFMESLEILQVLLAKFPDNPPGKQELARVRLRLDEQETGKYDFKRMYKAAKLRPPVLDCATFVGPVEVRDVEGKGRGLFTSHEVKCGELLACEKAFSYGCAEPPEEGSSESNAEFGVLINLTTNRVKLGTDAAHIPKVYQKLVDNPSLAPAFFDLCHDSYETPPTTSADGTPVVDSFLIERIVSLNTFGCPVTSKDQERSKKKHGGVSKSSGIWPLAAYINHSCMANCARTFIGDMMIMRAAQDLPPNTELTWCYHDPTDRAKLQKALSSHWGFECSCPVCVDELNTEVGLVKQRKEILSRINTAHITVARAFKAEMANPKLFSKLNSLYKTPAKNIPRYDAFVAFHSEAVYWFRKYVPTAAVDFAVRALEALGFVMDGFCDQGVLSNNMGRILIKKEYGVSVPEVARLWQIVSIMGSHPDLSNSSKVHQQLAKTSKIYWQTAYKIVVAGEDETFAKESKRFPAFLDGASSKNS